MRAISVAGISVTVVVALCLLLLLTGFGQRAYSKIERALSRFAERAPLASCILFFSVIAVRLLVLPLLPVPTPGMHDEFSYLLMGDTFAHGRLANPPHPLWLSFETFHEIWNPTYASMYPPAQGMLLAVGQLLGHPWVGVVLSNAIMCVAIFWAMRAWMPSRWAFLGGVIAALKLCVASYWINTYWGGAAATIGGALVLGGVGRIRRRASARDAVLLALGAAILANSRPYEGLFFCLPAAIWFLSWLAGKIKSRDALRSRLRNALVPAAAILLATATFMAYYNWRLTGNALLLPHTANARMYRTAGLFLWDHQKPPRHYNNQQLDDFYNGWERGNYDRTWAGVRRVTGEKFERYGRTYFWPGALLILPGLLFALRDRRMKFLWTTLAVGTAALFAVSWSLPHYAAPLICIFYALLVQAIRHLRTMRVTSLDFGVALSRAVILLLLLDTATSVCYRLCDAQQWTCQGNTIRSAIIEKLRRSAGNHLILVRYAPTHNPHHEWVFNGADIDAAKVLWARDLGAAQNAKLLAYFKERQVWLLSPDSSTQLGPYPAAASGDTEPDTSHANSPSKRKPITPQQ